MQARRRLALALALSAAVAALEFWGGARAHSLALTTDAVHVCMDVFTMAIALGAAIGVMRPANRRKTFGYGRLEVLGAMLNGALLLGASGVLAYEAVQRFAAPQATHGTLMTIVAAIGLAVNVGIAAFLREHHHGDLNVRAAFIHVAGDALAALFVIVGGALIAWTHAEWIDPLLSLVVVAIIVAGVVGVVRAAVDVLLESSPPGVDVADVESRMRAISGVRAVHDLHVWSIASGTHALSAHVLLDDSGLNAGPSILASLRRSLRDRYGIGHVTVQLESEHCDPGGIVICRDDGEPAKEGK